MILVISSSCIQLLKAYTSSLTLMNTQKTTMLVMKMVAKVTTIETFLATTTTIVTDCLIHVVMSGISQVCWWRTCYLLFFLRVRSHNILPCTSAHERYVINITATCVFSTLPGFHGYTPCLDITNLDVTKFIDVPKWRNCR